jgi:hypothetical protein
MGERVKITAKQGDKIYTFSGLVKRNDGLLPIRRIGRSVNAFYVMASDSAYHDFFCAVIQNNITNCNTIGRSEGSKGPGI